MFDCAKDLLAFHDDKVTLPTDEQDNMRERRNANRTRLKNGLEKAKEPTPFEHASQGSYAMRTMVQLPDGDHDIDDGAYFKIEALKGKQGADKTALAARQMVCDALDDGGFDRAPEVLKNCVRVYYKAGYQVDVPVYRIITTKDEAGKESYSYELASTDWKNSDARDVTAWFKDENKKQSPDAANGRQLRRVTRLIKYYTTSRSSWTGLLNGFGITKLVTEKYYANAGREDVAFYETVKAIRDRLQFNLVVKHPIAGNGDITDGNDDARARKLREKLDDALSTLAPLFDADCTREKALKCWDTLFATTFFIDRLSEEKSEAAASSGVSVAKVLTTGMITAAAAAEAAQAAVKKEGGDHYA